MESPEMKGGDVWNSNTKSIGSKFISRRERWAFCIPPPPQGILLTLIIGYVIYTEVVRVV